VMKELDLTLSSEFRFSGGKGNSEA
jgi:hypothetical protein